MTACGTNRTLRDVLCSVAIRGKVDIEQAAHIKRDYEYTR